MQTCIRNSRLAHLVTSTLVTLAFIRLYFLLPFSIKPDQIKWTPYSSAEIRNDLEEGKLVLISATASWSYDTALFEHIYSRDPVVLKLVRSQPITCYNIDVGDLPDEQFKAWQGYFDAVSPLGVILLAQNSNHEILKRAITIEGIYEQQLIPEIKKLREFQIEPSYRVAHIDPWFNAISDR